MGERYRRSNRQKYKKRRQQAGFSVFLALMICVLGGLAFFGLDPVERASSEELVQRPDTPTTEAPPEAVKDAKEIKAEDRAEARAEAKAEAEANEPDVVEVPDIPYNATEKEAKEMLEGEGLELGEVKKEANDDYDKGGVFLQDPLPNAEVDEGSSVGITLSSGPEKNDGGDEDIPDPGTTELYLTVPKMGLVDDYVVNDASEATLLNGAGKIPETGFPWQESANTYIASHVLGYSGTGSEAHFAALPNMTYGDEIILTDTNGTTYTYEVSEILTVSPYDVWVTEPQVGRDMVSLQTCVNPPAYDLRLVVHADRVGVDVA